MAAAGSECMETRAAMLVQQLLRVQAASSECRETMGSKSVRFADKVSFMEGHDVAPEEQLSVW